MFAHDAPQSDDRGDAAGAPSDRAVDPLGQTQAPGGETAGRKQSLASVGSAVRLWIGRRIGRYEIRDLLGTGGMGVVFKAFDTAIEREVALKLLPFELSSDTNNLGRFLAEAKAAGKLSHPNAVAIYEIGQDGEMHYLVMEYVGGGSIAERWDKIGAFPVAEATRIIADACRGLAAAHAVGLIHRDIKPANLLRAADGSVKVADFGLAKRVLDTSNQLTQDGKIVGTPYFMSPEQCEAAPLDPRSDIYSLGATYYSLLSGQNPFGDAGSIVQVMYAHCKGDIPDPRRVRPDIPEACSQIVHRAMAKLPDDRYQSAGEMLADLEAVIATMSDVHIALPSQSQLQPVAPRALDAVEATRGKSSWLPYAAGAAVVCLLLALASVFMNRLGGDAGSQGQTPGASPPSTSASLAPGGAVPLLPTGEPIKVGVLHSLSGTMAESESPVVDATLLAIEELNAAGGVLGRPVQAIVKNGRSDAQVFAAEAEKLIVEDRVCTVFGCWTSASRKTVLPVLEKHEHLLVYPVQYEGLEESPYVIYMGAAPNQQIIPAVKWAFAFQDKRRFFIVGSDYVFPRAAGEIIRDTLAELKGDLVGEEYLPLGTFDTRDVVARIVAAQPDVILNTINGSTNVAFFKALRAAGITPEKTCTISFSIGEEELRRLSVPDIAGDYAAWNYFQSIDSPANRQFVSGFQAKYGAQRVLTDPMEAAYIGVKLWAQAVVRAGSDDVRQIRLAFTDERALAPEGEIRVDPATRHVYKTPRIGQVNGEGQFDVVWKAVKPEAPVPFPPSRSKAAWEQFLHGLYENWGGEWTAPAR